VAQSKPLGSHELKGQLAVWGGVGAAGAGLYAASENEKRKQGEDYYAKRAAFDYENKDVPGITGDRLAEIQTFLNYVVPPEENEEELTPDGKFGRKTAERLKRYQEMRGLKANGRRTWQTIEDIEREMSGEAEPKKAQAR
jgi:peptidoglycan hydrolase-like protein with peptidoglycan-binding domain